MEPTRIFRSSYGRILTVAAGAGAVGAIVSLVVSDGGIGLVRYGTIPTFVAVLVWAVFWRPEVRINRTGVTVVNVWSTKEVPWADLYGVTTRWALELQTSAGRVSAWAVPPESGTLARGLRRAPRESEDSRPTADQVAEVIRTWDPRDTDRQGVETTWHLTTIVTLAVLATVAMLAAQA